MKLQDQVTSLEISKRLKELGVKQESLFAWFPRYKMEDWSVDYVDKVMPYPINGVRASVSAFTVAELGEMLPKSLYSESGEQYTLGVSWDVEDKPYCFYENIYGYFKDQRESADTEADARGKCLIYLLENNLTPRNDMREE